MSNGPKSSHICIDICIHIYIYIPLYVYIHTYVRIICVYERQAPRRVSLYTWGPRGTEISSLGKV